MRLLRVRACSRCARARGRARVSVCCVRVFDCVRVCLCARVRVRARARVPTRIPPRTTANLPALYQRLGPPPLHAGRCRPARPAVARRWAFVGHGLEPAITDWAVTDLAIIDRAMADGRSSLIGPSLIRDPLRHMVVAGNQ